MEETPLEPIIYPLPDDIGRAKESDLEREERRLKREEGHGTRRSSKAKRKATRGAFGGRRK